MVLGQAAGQPGRAAYYGLCHLLSLPPCHLRDGDNVGDLTGVGSGRQDGK